ncbi:MAG: cysteine desulfurase, partial [Deltaproteobacteria bacterium]|nr:cysteine desulfurase [Deltaproteobacteria bacterium]
LSGLLQKIAPKEKKIILTTPIEHSSVLMTLETWAKRGFELQFLKVNREGFVDLEDLTQKLSPSVALVSVMAVNNEIGTIQPIEQIGSLLRKRDFRVPFHVDAVQAFGKIPLEFGSWGVNLLSISSHKIHGPIGAGALITDGKMRLEPLLWGGGQEHGLRSGTESIGMIYGFYLAACDILQNQNKSHEAVLALKQKLIEGIRKLPFDVKLNTPKQSSPYILNLSFKGSESEVLLRMLEEEGIFVSPGASCNAKKRKPSHVLKGIGCVDSEIFSALRFSFSPYTKESEIDEALKVLPPILSRLQNLK